jgi:outer membrane lipoprotein SlyB
MAVAAAGWIATGAPAAQAAQGAGLAVEGVDVEQVSQVAAGVALRFRVYGTPHATAALRIEGGWHVLFLHETEPGIYEGTYVIDGRDAILPTSRVTATLQEGDVLAQGDLDQPLLLAEVPLPWAEAAATLAARPASALPAGGAAPAPAATVVPPPAAVVVPPGTDTVAPPTTGATAPVADRRAKRAACADCAWVQSVRRVETPPGGAIGAIGAIAGAIAGAVLGDELGKEHTRHMLAVLGAIGGAFAGHEIEQQATSRVHYEVVLRTTDGGAQVRRYVHAPPFAPGDTVRLGAAGAAPPPF